MRISYNIVGTDVRMMWPCYTALEDLLKQQYNIHLHQKKFLGYSRPQHQLIHTVILKTVLLQYISSYLTKTFIEF
jgi:hypothetical protein